MKKKSLISIDKASFEVKVGLAEMLKGGVIIDVMTPEQAQIAEESGAVAVVALEKNPADIHAEGGISRMSHPEIIQKIQESVSIPVVAKCRIGHFVEAQILESLFIDFIDESELLTPSDEEFYIDKQNFRIPFVCGCKDLGEALRRIGEGAAMIRTKCDPGSNSIANAVRQMRSINRGVNQLSKMDHAELMVESKRLGAPYHLVEEIAETGKLPVPNFAAGGIVTPADAALLMQLGADSIFIGSEVFKFDDAQIRVRAIVEAVAYHRDPVILGRISMGLLDPLLGLELQSIRKEELFNSRGW